MASNEHQQYQFTEQQEQATINRVTHQTQQLASELSLCRQHESMAISQVDSAHLELTQEKLRTQTLETQLVQISQQHTLAQSKIHGPGAQGSTTPSMIRCLSTERQQYRLAEQSAHQAYHNERNTAQQLRSQLTTNDDTIASLKAAVATHGNDTGSQDNILRTQIQQLRDDNAEQQRKLTKAISDVGDTSRQLMAAQSEALNNKVEGNKKLHTLQHTNTQLTQQVTSLQLTLTGSPNPQQHQTLQQEVT